MFAVFPAPPRQHVLVKMVFPSNHCLSFSGRDLAHHLKFEFTAEDPAGNTPDNAQILGALRNLRKFMHGFDFLKMSPNVNFVVSGLPTGVFCRGMSEPGKQYALYHRHSEYKSLAGPSSYVVHPANYAEDLLLNLPGGSYKAELGDSGG